MGGKEVSIDQKCERCRTEEYIPTHQYFKFEEDVHYLCGACWELGKGWFFRGARAFDFVNDSSANLRAAGYSDDEIRHIFNPKSDQRGICSRCPTQEYMPENQFLVMGDDPTKKLFLDQACWELWKAWYYRGARSLEGGCEDFKR